MPSWGYCRNYGPAAVRQAIAKLPGLSQTYVESLDKVVDLILPAPLTPEAKEFEESQRAKENFRDDDAFEDALRLLNYSRVLVENVAEVAVQPVIDDENAALFIRKIIGSHDSGRARIITDDLHQLEIDLSAVALDEVLDFRRSGCGSEYRAYSRDVRLFVLELSQLSYAEQIAALAARRAEINDRIDELNRLTSRAFRRQLASLGFGLAGAAWTLVHGDPWGGLFAAGATAAGVSGCQYQPVGLLIPTLYVRKLNYEDENGMFRCHGSDGIA